MVVELHMFHLVCAGGKALIKNFPALEQGRHGWKQTSSAVQVARAMMALNDKDVETVTVSQCQSASGTANARTNDDHVKVGRGAANSAVQFDL